MPYTPHPYVARLALSSRAMRTLSAINLPPGNIADTVVISGSPRSGTTWLAELVSTLPGYTLVDEPLHLRWPDVKAAGIRDWRTYISSDSMQPRAHTYLERVLRAQVPSNRQFEAQHPVGQLFELVFGSRNVVKLVRGNRMLGWIQAQFQPRGTILIVRHPCAVVASQLKYKHPGWRKTKAPPPEHLQSAFGGWIPDSMFSRFESTLAAVDSTASRLAAVWCLDTYLALYDPEPFQGIVTTYEGLLTKPEKEISRIFHELGSAVPPDVLPALDERSSSASADLKTTDVEAQLGKWKSKLQSGQIEDVIRIVDGFGLKFYSDKLEPDYSSLQESTQV